MKLSKNTPFTEFVNLETIEEMKAGEQIAIFGYPKQKLDRQNPYDSFDLTGAKCYQKGLVKGSQALIKIRKDFGDIIYSLSTKRGQSGSPIVLISNQTFKIIGLHKGGI